MILKWYLFTNIRIQFDRLQATFFHHQISRIKDDDDDDDDNDDVDDVNVVNDDDDDVDDDDDDVDGGSNGRC
uniref:Uncharacterized protein n=1 Tax=Onchocerca volvulus TaxID=6282 RepID=A0A8R1TNV4_ONCVO